jgi:hypothetical protein
MTQSANDYTIKQFIKQMETIKRLDTGMLSVVYGNFSNASNVAKYKDDFSLWLVSYLLQNQIADVSFNQTLRQMFGLTLDKFKLMSMYVSETVSDDYFIDYWDPVYGNCFKFNSGKKQNGSLLPVLQQKEMGQNNGLFSVNLVDVYPNQSHSFMDLVNSWSWALEYPWTTRTRYRSLSTT